MLKTIFMQALIGVVAVNLAIISENVKAEELSTVPANKSSPDVAPLARTEKITVPAGVFGANAIDEGRLMIGYTPMYMHMQDNYIGSSGVSAETIVTTVPSAVKLGNGTSEMYRIVPTSMNVSAQMFHVMYGVADGVTLMAMTSYLDKSMNMTTYAGSSGAKVLGQSSGVTSGFGDTALNSLWRIYRSGTGSAQLGLGLSLPTGSINETTSMLSPANRMMTMRASYGMQLGSGTLDFLPGLTYTGHEERWSWGTAYRGRIALNGNSNGYRYANKHELDLWGGYGLTHGVTLTGRLAGSTQGAIRGADAQISGLMPGSNPAFYGGRRIDLFGGVDIPGKAMGFKSGKLSIEAGNTVYRNLNGPQLGSSWQVNALIGISI